MFLVYLLYLKINPSNSFLILSSLSSVDASNLAVKLGPVLDALTLAQESSKVTLTPSILL